MAGDGGTTRSLSWNARPGRRCARLRRKPLYSRGSLVRRLLPTYGGLHWGWSEGALPLKPPRVRGDLGAALEFERQQWSSDERHTTLSLASASMRSDREPITLMGGHLVAVPPASPVRTQSAMYCDKPAKAGRIEVRRMNGTAHKRVRDTASSALDGLANAASLLPPVGSAGRLAQRAESPTRRLRRGPARWSPAGQVDEIVVTDAASSGVLRQRRRNERRRYRRRARGPRSGRFHRGNQRSLAVSRLESSMPVEVVP